VEEETGNYKVDLRRRVQMVKNSVSVSRAQPSADRVGGATTPPYA